VQTKIVMFSGLMTPDDMARMMASGADDFLAKPLSLVQLRARVKAVLELLHAQRTAAALHAQLVKAHTDLRREFATSLQDLEQARHALVHVLAKVAEQRAGETPRHLSRLQRYCRTLGEAALADGVFAGVLDLQFVDLLECVVPLHDLGKIALPDHILLHPGKLVPEERIHMQTHTVLGAEILTAVLQQHCFAPDFMQMAVDVTRHHHERLDGRGYPDRLQGAQIPSLSTPAVARHGLAART
jgi:response regulator RpfG family c-di-GMP phosphodiesterase